MAKTIQPLEPTMPVDSDIQDLIYVVRGQQVMLDRDLATLYGVETKVLNQAVKRNINRFPDDFMFQLTPEECLRSQIVTSNDRRRGGTRYMPYVFTENGVAMLSGILRSGTAIEVNIQIMRAFTKMRHFLANNASVFRRLDEGSCKPQQGIFYDGQVYDAYTFVADLVKSAKHRIILIDNYIEETVLTLLDKRAAEVQVTIYTQQISRQLQLDIDRHNAQYPPIEVNIFRLSHDRFLCIDEAVYHVGASIKDLGKKWFGFSKMELLTPEELVERINRG